MEFDTERAFLTSLKTQPDQNSRNRLTKLRLTKKYPLQHRRGPKHKKHKTHWTTTHRRTRNTRTKTTRKRINYPATQTRVTTFEILARATDSWRTAQTERLQPMLNLLEKDSEALRTAIETLNKTTTTQRTINLAMITVVTIITIINVCLGYTAQLGRSIANLAKDTTTKLTTQYAHYTNVLTKMGRYIQANIARNKRRRKGRPNHAATNKHKRTITHIIIKAGQIEHTKVGGGGTKRDLHAIQQVYGVSLNGEDQHSHAFLWDDQILAAITLADTAQSEILSPDTTENIFDSFRSEITN